MSSKRLEGKIAIITGAAGGIGEASALLFAREGAKIAAVDLTEEALAPVVRQILDEGGKAIAIGADVTKTADVKRIGECTIGEFGFPNVLFNNAGINGERRRTLLDIEEADFDRTVEVNLKGPFLMMKYLVPHMIKAGGGSIINTASLGGIVTASTAGYSASKAGLIAMTRVAASELGRYNIRVNALCPGATETPLAAKQRVDLEARGLPTANQIINRLSVFGRMGEPMEMAKMALFLASDDLSYATGVPFINDGGWMSIGAVQNGPDRA